ncbi:MAG TPA: chorismate mutase [Candidatus Wallbacteria bacterium]|nr:chorismate mutase [Candidatus Wallbacteria bacterium]
MQSAVKKLRLVIDNIDSLIIKLLNKRLKTSAGIQKIKSASLPFSPSREKQILAKCPAGEIFSIYLAVLMNSRKFAKNIKWYYISGADKKSDEKAMALFSKIFGSGISPSVLGGEKNLKEALAGKAVIISPRGDLSGAAECGYKMKLYKYCDYKIKNRPVFSFYSTIEPAFESDLDAVIDIK